jgi:hypothetical protein
MEPKSLLCAVCGEAEHPRRFVVQGRPVVLCGVHAAMLTRARPKTLEQLQELFRPRCGITTLADRRSPIPRRAPEPVDRRFFPRPEGRRKKAGRRITDVEG